MKTNNHNTSYDTDREIKNIATFVRCGLLVLSVIFVSAFAIAYGQNKLAQSTSGRIYGKRLPIYCVEQDKPKIALSFDAAWGNII